MVGFNWVDVIIVLLFASAVFFGFRVGFLRLFLTFGGFFLGLFLSGLVLPHILPIHNRTVLAIVNGNLVLIVAVFGALKGYDQGKKVHASLKASRLHFVESLAGVTLSFSSAVITIWLIAAAIGALPFVGFSNAMNGSFFIQLFDRHFPAAPSVFSGFSTLVDPNITPKVYIKALPDASIGSAPLPPATNAVLQTGQSVVRITSFGCGGIIDGSGFVIAPGLVATNAHVIAGVTRPIVKYRNQSFSSYPVLFDPNLDFAVLKVPSLNAPATTIDSFNVFGKAAIDIIGYPASIYTITPGQIVDSLPVEGSNIYGLGAIVRSIYIIQANISAGSSGSPAVLPNGTVAGMVFARSTINPRYAYALTANEFTSAIATAEHAKTHIGTGTCYAGE